MEAVGAREVCGDDYECRGHPLCRVRVEHTHIGHAERDAGDEIGEDEVRADEDGVEEDEEGRVKEGEKRAASAGRGKDVGDVDDHVNNGLGRAIRGSDRGQGVGVRQGARLG